MSYAKTITPPGAGSSTRPATWQLSIVPPVEKGRMNAEASLLLRVSFRSVPTVRMYVVCGRRLPLKDISTSRPPHSNLRSPGDGERYADSWNDRRSTYSENSRRTVVSRKCSSPERGDEATMEGGTESSGPPDGATCEAQPAAPANAATRSHENNFIPEPARSVSTTGRSLPRHRIDRFDTPRERVFFPLRRHCGRGGGGRPSPLKFPDRP